MKKILLLMVLVVGFAGCETTASRKDVPDASVATVPASEDQVVVAKHRAEFIFGRMPPLTQEKFLRQKPALLAVRTLNLTPEQAAPISGSFSGLPDTVTCVLLWDASTKELVNQEVFVVVTPPENDSQARFGTHFARYVGSL